MKYLTILLILLVGCKKKSTTPSSMVQPTETKVWCFYQTNISKAFLDCAKNETEYQTKLIQYSGLQISVEVKTNCNECQ